MPRSFRSFLLHADELLDGPGSHEAEMEIRSAPAEESERRDRELQGSGAVHQLLFERSQDDRPKRLKPSMRPPPSHEDA